MSAVALDRQYRWRPNLQDFSSHLQPPAAPRPTCILNYPRQPTHTRPAAHIISSQHFESSSGLTHALQSHSVLPTHTRIFPYPNPSPVTSSHTFTSQQPTAESLKRDCKPNPTLAVRMHAQATSASLAVSTIEDIAAPRKLSSEVLSPQPSYTPPSLTPSALHTTCSSNTITITTTLPCQASDAITSSSSTTTTPLAHFTASTNESTESSDENQSSCCCRAKSYSKCSSRSSVAAKNKGGCFQRRRLIDEEGYIRRAACVCVNKEETQVLLVSSKKDPCVWLVPGGGLEAGEDNITAAKREAWEEAGIQGDIARYLGLFESFHHSGAKKHRTAVYIFVVTEEHNDFPEARLGRRRQWFSMEEALLHLARHRPLQSAYLQFLMMSKLKVAAAS